LSAVWDVDQNIEVLKQRALSPRYVTRDNPAFPN
jgi:hypothetical protein